MTPIDPPLTAPSDLDAALRSEGFAVLSGGDLAALAAVRRPDLEALTPFWDDLPLDAHLRDGGRYRRRRHGCFIVADGQVALQPPRPHWQPVEYNALHGGVERTFAPLAPAMVAAPAWNRLLSALGERASALRGSQPWYVEAHPFRIETVDGIGRPTPEGAHRDGVDLVAVILVAREAVRGGETRVFEAHGPRGSRFMLTAPWTAMLLDDARVIHETTPIQPRLDEPAGANGHRDTLVLTYRAGGFQARPAT
jgi:hypothetical protein